MQVIIHAGAHGTDEDRLIGCLSENRETLARHGVRAPDPARYRRLIRDILNAAGDGSLPQGAREALCDALGEDGAAERLILSNAGFFGTPKMAVGGGLFYRAAEQRLELFRQMFPGARIELFLGLRDPAGFLPALLAGTNFAAMDELLRGSDPADMRWSELIGRIRASHPDMPVTLWCNEDTPLVWARILRALAGLGTDVPLAGEHALLPEILSAAGFARFEAYMARQPDLTEAQKTRIIEAFLDRFATEAALEEEVDLPGWSEELIATLGRLYDADMAEIRQIAGVRLIAP